MKRKGLITDFRLLDILLIVLLPVGAFLVYVVFPWPTRRARLKSFLGRLHDPSDMPLWFICSMSVIAIVSPVFPERENGLRARYGGEFVNWVLDRHKSTVR